MKKIIAVIFALVLVLMCSVTAFSGTAKVLKFVSEPFTEENGTQTVDLVAENIGEITMLQFAIGYDETKLQVESVTAEKFNQVLVNYSEPGVIRIVWDALSPVNTDGTVATITFRAVSDVLCETSIGFIEGEDLIIADADWEPIPEEDIRADEGTVVIDYEHEHTWDSWTVTEDPTCTEPGERYHTCTAYKGTCGEVATEEIPALGHSWSDWEEIFAPDCLNAGSKVRICGVCFEEEEAEIPALGHDWGEAEYEWSKDGKSCTAERVCKNDAQHTEEVKAEVSGKEVKAPTCTEMGETEYTAVFSCDWASEQITSRTDIEALGHEWSDWEVTLEPTYTTEGAQHRDCSVCGETQNEVIPKLPTDITISDKTIVVGGKKTVSVNITEGSEATAVQFVLKYDPSVLKVVSVTPGTAVADATINSGIEGLVIFAWEAIDAINTAETLLNIEFTTAEGAAACETKVEIDTVNEDFVFADENQKSIRNNISGGLITVIDVIYGDIDGNEKVNVLDANLIRRYAARLASLEDNQLVAADVDGNGKVNVLDANLVRRYAARLINIFPVEEK